MVAVVKGETEEVLLAVAVDDYEGTWVKFERGATGCWESMCYPILQTGAGCTLVDGWG